MTPDISYISIDTEFANLTRLSNRAIIKLGIGDKRAYSEGAVNAFRYTTARLFAEEILKHKEYLKFEEPARSYVVIATAEAILMTENELLALCERWYGMGRDSRPYCIIKERK